MTGRGAHDGGAAPQPVEPVGHQRATPCRPSRARGRARGPPRCSTRARRARTRRRARDSSSRARRRSARAIRQTAVRCRPGSAGRRAPTAAPTPASIPSARQRRCAPVGRAQRRQHRRHTRVDGGCGRLRRREAIDFLQHEQPLDPPVQRRVAALVRPPPASTPASSSPARRTASPGARPRSPGHGRSPARCADTAHSSSASDDEHGRTQRDSIRSQSSRSIRVISQSSIGNPQSAIQNACPRLMCSSVSRSCSPLGQPAAIQLEAQVDADRADGRQVSQPEPGRRLDLAEVEVADPIEDLAGVHEADRAQAAEDRHAQLGVERRGRRGRPSGSRWRRSSGTECPADRARSRGPTCRRRRRTARWPAGPSPPGSMGWPSGPRTGSPSSSTTGTSRSNPRARPSRAPAANTVARRPGSRR